MEKEDSESRFINTVNAVTKFIPVITALIIAITGLVTALAPFVNNTSADNLRKEVQQKLDTMW